ncbi:MAG TPA: phenylalanine--tRNA ligase subunit beta [Bacteroidia bacterium]|nr:phenylalanine--tRNA ligase subunit beta [Bacteroidia bacterium]
MKISLNWLNDYFPSDKSAEEIAALLTGCGLEVESVETFESIPGGLKGLVVGEVMEKTKHPNADKLSLTKVDVGGTELLSIVCGASNVQAGQKVIVATVGTTVHPVEGEPFEIKKSKIRGELSEGMICAEDEIGLGSSHAGIMVLDPSAKTGTPATEYFGIKTDHVLEIGLTPNRADAASHFGVARDLSAVVLAAELLKDVSAEHVLAQLPPAVTFEDGLPVSPVSVDVKDTEACVRYSGIYLTGVEVKDSPEWLQQRLKAIGVRPVNNVVDVTNYVLHELGQPLHAFDAERISGNKIVVRKANEGEKFVTLDGTERKLSANDLMICDAGKPMCMAGVFGGLDSGVTEKTKTIFLESACFNPVHVRKTSKRHSLKTDSSFRFERGTDPEMTMFALQRAAYLLEEVAGASVAAEAVDIYPVKVEPKQVAFTYAKCETLIGKRIEHAIVRKILLALGMEIISEGKDALLLSVPPFKVDVTRDADVVEEVLRVYGYNNIGFPDFLRASLSYSPKPDAEKVNDAIADLLAANGFREMLNNSLTKAAYYDLLEGNNASSNVALLNPLSSDLGIMRRSLLFGGLETIAYNRNRKSEDLRLFEFGKTYLKKQDVPEGKWPYVELQRLALFITGRKEPESWNTKKNPVDFTDLKKSVRMIADRLGLDNMKFSKTESPEFSEAMALAVRKKEVARFGKVKQDICKAFDIDAAVWFADIDRDAILSLLSAAKPVRFSEIPKFPSVRRDLALVLDKKITYGEIEDIAWQTEKNLLREVNLFDVYEGDKIDAGKKSCAVSFILQDEKATLTDQQVEKVMEKLVKVYSEKLGAVIRS